MQKTPHEFAHYEVIMRDPTTLQTSRYVFYCEDANDAYGDAETAHPDLDVFRIAEIAGTRGT